VNTNTRISSDLNTRTNRLHGSTRHHKLPICTTTGLARYRDRHQARDAVQSITAGRARSEISTFTCPDCRGCHLEKARAFRPVVELLAAEPAEAFTASLPLHTRRYFLFDVENPTRGAKFTCAELATFWSVLKLQAPGIAPHDHVVIGASRSVRKKYRSVIFGPNVKWVTGANAPDGADHALLAAIDLRRVARDYDELVIVSGDHIFVELASRAKALGLRVHVVTAEQPESRPALSHKLAAIANVRTLVRLTPRTPQRDNLTLVGQSVGLASHSLYLDAVAA